ncbi:MAG: O-antigen ligase family protein [Steroidobacteraceae bacterium]
MIGKDVAYAPFPYAMRAVAQTLCLGTGLIALLPMLSTALVARYWPVLGYLFVLLLTAPFTQFPLFVLLEVLSLASAIVFAIAYFESPQRTLQTNLGQLVVCIVAVYGIVIVISLVLARIAPNVAYEALFAGDETGIESRYRGLFSKAGVMAAASGLLVGLSAISIKRWPLKMVFLIPGLMCLALTQSRSFWLAAFVAGGVTAWQYYPLLRKWIFAGFAVVALAGVLTLGFKISVDTAGVSSFARWESVSTLTGRTELWQAAFKGWSERPWFGYGYTLGGLGVLGEQSVSNDSDPTYFSRTTLHNGYIQSVMDAGLIGFFFYAMTFLIAISRVVRYDSEKQFPEALYVLLFLSIANGGESVVYSGAVFQSLCFWVFAVFALGVRAPEKAAMKEALINPSPASPIALTRPPNLLH